MLNWVAISTAANEACPHRNWAAEQVRKGNKAEKVAEKVVTEAEMGSRSAVELNLLVEEDTEGCKGVQDSERSSTQRMGWHR